MVSRLKQELHFIGEEFGRNEMKSLVQIPLIPEKVGRNEMKALAQIPLIPEKLKTLLELLSLLLNFFDKNETETLQQQTPSLSEEFDENEMTSSFSTARHSLRRITTEIQEVAAEGKKMGKKSTLATIIGGAVCVVGAVAAPATGGLSLSLVGPGAALIGTSETRRGKKEKETISQIRKLRGKFTMIVEKLEDELKKLMTADLDGRMREIVSSMLEKVDKLGNAVVSKTDKELQDFSTKEADDLQTILNELDQMKKKLQQEEERRRREKEKKKKLSSTVVPKTVPELQPSTTKTAASRKINLNVFDDMEEEEDEVSNENAYRHRQFASLQYIIEKERQEKEEEKRSREEEEKNREDSGSTCLMPLRQLYQGNCN